MIKLTIIVHFYNGFHARPASNFIREIKNFDLKKCDAETKNVSCNGLSLLSMLMLSAGPGNSVDFSIEGKDEKKAAEFIKDFFSKEKSNTIYD